jgi:hypothetical protein
MGKIKEIGNYTDRELFHVNGTLSPERIERLLDRQDTLEEEIDGLQAIDPAAVRTWREVVDKLRTIMGRGILSTGGAIINTDAVARLNALLDSLAESMDDELDGI